MKKQDLLICIREDNYCIDTLEMIRHPQINEIVEVRRVVVDEVGVWLCLFGYHGDLFDVICFKKLTL